MFVADLNRALADCGDGIEVKADGNRILTAQVEGTDPKYLNLVSQPDGVRLPEITVVGGLPLPLEPGDEPPPLTDEDAPPPVDAPEPPPADLDDLPNDGD